MQAFRKDAEGTTAIEFAMVAAPFMALLFGIIAVGLYFFTVFSMENAVEQASRLIRTGQAQTSGMTPQVFKEKLCSFVPGHIDCANKVHVNVKSYANSADITPASLPKCLDGGGNLKTSSDFIPGGQSAVVLVWVCYEWEMAKFPYINFGDMNNGSMLVQATTTFRTEPYSN